MSNFAFVDPTFVGEKELVAEAIAMIASETKGYKNPLELPENYGHGGVLFTDSTPVLHKNRGAVGSGFYNSKKNKKTQGNAGLNAALGVLSNPTQKDQIFDRVQMDLIYFSQEELIVLTNEEGTSVFRAVSELFGVIITNDKNFLEVLISIDTSVDLYQLTNNSLIDIKHGQASLLQTA
jgi:hypothetical protein